MRIVWVGLLTLLAGLLLGGLGPRNDLRTARDRISELEKELASKNRPRGRASGITDMLRIPVKAPPPAPERTTVALQVGTGGNATPTTNTTTRRAWRRRLANDEQRQQFRNEIQTAADAWRVRSDLARNSFVSNVATNPEQATTFDVLMAAMNLRLSNSISRWAESISTDRDMSPETGIRMMNELSEVVVLAYDDMDRNLPVDWRDRAGEEFQLFDFVDPSVALPLAGADGSQSGDESGSSP